MELEDRLREVAAVYVLLLSLWVTALAICKFRNLKSYLFLDFCQNCDDVPLDRLDGHSKLSCVQFNGIFQHRFILKYKRGFQT